jgi:hypothetical protein
MSDYTPPPKNDIIFKFGPTGYSSPDFNNINFKFPATHYNLKSQIVGRELQRDYVKECKTHVIGYNQNNLQIIKERCIYGGIRDLMAQIIIDSHIFELPQYIKPTNRVYNDIIGYTKAWYKEQFIELRKTVKGWGQATFDLNAYTTLKETASYDIIGYIDIQDRYSLDITGNIKPWYRKQPIDIDKTIKGWKNVYYDLMNYTKATENLYEEIPLYIKSTAQNFEDIVNAIKGKVSAYIDLFEYIKSTQKQIVDFPSYIKSTIHQIEDLNLDIFKIWQTDVDLLDASIHGWQVENLQKIIQAFHTQDLHAVLRATYLHNIMSYIYGIPPEDIAANLHGFATFNLSSDLIPEKHKGDLPVYLNVNPHNNLPVVISAKKGIEVIKDLSARLTNLKISDLTSSVNIISTFDLAAILIVPRMILNLNFSIYPKVVYIRNNINISFLEHRDLAGIINYPCAFSGYLDLFFSVFVKNSLDLRATVYGSDNSNIVDLGARINAYDYMTFDTLNVQFFNKGKPKEYRTTYMDVKFNNKTRVDKVDTLTLYLGDISKAWFDMAASINGDYITRDLPVKIVAYSNNSFDTSASSKLFVTLKLKNNEEEFRRYVDLKLRDYANSYYYFSGNQRAYREHATDHWEIRVQGFDLVPVGRGIEKKRVRKKYIFNLKKYNSIDEAIKDMIDRVTLLRTSDLGMQIFPKSTVALENERDLGFVIYSKKIYKTNRVLQSIIRPAFKQHTDLFSVVLPKLNNSAGDLGLSITGDDYIGPTSGQVDFEFNSPEETIPPPENANFEFSI